MFEAVKIYGNIFKNTAINRTQYTAIAPKLWTEYYKWKSKSRDRNALQFLTLGNPKPREI